ncbi:unnamed protein product [Dicrocoelium dendriticum]|nr:unnamed protein product [Dicrocoelium dendriticum]
MNIFKMLTPNICVQYGFLVGIFALICFNFNSKLLYHKWKKKRKAEFNLAQTEPSSFKESGWKFQNISVDSREVTVPIQPTTTSPRRISQSSCIPSSNSAYHSSSLLTSTDLAVSGDHSAGESGYETFERPWVPKISNTTINQLGTSPDKVSSIKQKLSTLSSFSRLVEPLGRYCLRTFNGKTNSATQQTSVLFKRETDELSKDLMVNKTHLLGQGCKSCRTSSRHLHIGCGSNYTQATCGNDLHTGFESPSNLLGLQPAVSQWSIIQNENFELGDQRSGANSIGKNSALIDPIYCKIQKSFDQLEQGDIHDVNNFEEEDNLPWCELCWKRNSISSGKSQPFSAHPSSHIYYELQDSQKSSGDLKLSAWSIPYLLNRDNEVSSDLGSTRPTSTPPQLPSRSYGQSTVNLVNRLRNILQNKRKKACSIFKATCSETRVASTLCSFVARPHLYSLSSTFSMTNINLTQDSDAPIIPEKCVTYISAIGGQDVKDVQSESTSLRQNTLPKLTSSKFGSVGFGSNEKLSWTRIIANTKETANISFGRQNRKSNDNIQTNQPNAAKTAIFSSRKIWAPSLQRCRANSLAKSTYNIKLIRQLPKGMDGSQHSIRHIDSETDIVELFGDSLKPTEFCHSSSSLLAPMCHVYTPRHQTSVDQVHFVKSPEQRVYKNTHGFIEKQLWSPSRRATETTHTMSPLMERSIEDEESRRLLSLCR